MQRTAAPRRTATIAARSRATARACTTEGARSCTGHGTRSPLRCEGSVWIAEPDCSDNERCVSTEGPDQGMCRPIARECLNQTPEVPFCNADEAMLVCLQQQKLVAKIGFGLALDGDRLAVSAPRLEFAATLVKRAPGEVFLFERGQDDRWSQTSVLRALEPAPGDYYGVSLAMVGDALLVGSNGESSGGRTVGADPSAGSSDYSGAAYLYVRVGHDWMPSGFFKASNRDANDGLGYSVALSADTAFAAAVYESSNASGIDGDQTDNSLMNSGAVYAFH